MTSDIYNKQNSFIAIRHGMSNARDVNNRIKNLFETVDEKALPPEWVDVFCRLRDELIYKIDPGDGIRFEILKNVRDEFNRVPDSKLLRYLIYRYRYEIHPQRKILDDFPPCLQIEPASVCNYRCVFCYQTDKFFTQHDSGFMGTMSLDLFKAVIDQTQGRCEAVTLASRGEPLLCPDIETMLDYCQDKFLGLKMNTNAWYLDESKAHAILQSGMNTLVFSVDCTNEALYSKLRVGGRLDRVVDNISRFREIRTKHYPKHNIITRVSGVQFHEEQQDLDEMEAFWEDLVDQVAFVKYNPWENVYSQAVNDILIPCSDLWRRMFVWFDGTVNPCDVDYRSMLAFGTANDTPLSDIWLSNSYNDLRETHLSNLRSRISPCKRCLFV